MKHEDGNNNPSISETNDDGGMGKKSHLLVDHLINSVDPDGRPSFSDVQIRDHVLTTLSAVSSLKRFFQKTLN